MLLFARRSSVIAPSATAVVPPLSVPLALSSCAALLATLAVSGCSSVPTFPLPPRDSGVHCSDTESCPSGQVCLQGRCYAGCDATHGCGPREMCSAGVCVASTTDAGAPPHDVGIDGGPCPMLDCMMPTPACRADLAMCVQCDATNDDMCGLATGPVCDVGRAACTSGAPAICAPCTRTADCPSGLSCVHRTSPDADERVCLPGCLTAACSDQGFSCVSALCVPFASSCTAYRAAVARRPCTSDTDCPQLGATIDNGLVTHMCFDDGTMSDGMTCHAACGLSTDCPVGMTCVSNFCQ
jgi:hypothetical protein